MITRLIGRTTPQEKLVLWLEPDSNEDYRTLEIMAKDAESKVHRDHTTHAITHVTMELTDREPTKGPMASMAQHNAGVEPDG